MSLSDERYAGRRFVVPQGPLRHAQTRSLESHVRSFQCYVDCVSGIDVIVFWVVNNFSCIG